MTQGNCLIFNGNPEISDSLLGQINPERRGFLHFSSDEMRFDLTRIESQIPVQQSILQDDDGNDRPRG